MDIKKPFLHILLPCLILIPVLLLLLLVPKQGWGEGNYPLTGRYVETPSGRHLLYRNTDTGEMRYVFLLPAEDAAMFNAFEPGDTIRVQSAPRIEETEERLCYVAVQAPKKVWDLATIPQLTDKVLAHIAELDSMFSP